MEQGEHEGMQTFDGVLEGMIRSGVVKKDVALPYASNPNNLLLRLADFGGTSTANPTAGQPSSQGTPASDKDSMIDIIER
jgi:Tfp pilus assembly ATPase PilU